MNKQAPNDVGQLERKTQDRVVALFQRALKYNYLGNWEERENNSNIEEKLLRAFLTRSQCSDTVIGEAIAELKKSANRPQMSLYDLNKETYGLLRYGVKIREGLGENYKTVWLIDWKNPEDNDFAIAEEVTIRGNRTKRPDIVLYVNGIALGVIELKRSIVSVSEGIRQNIGNQKEEFIKSFFATVQLEKIVFDILDDFYKKDRLASGRGNAMLVASSIYEACQYYDLFQTQGFAKCAVVTSYEPDALSTDTREYAVYQKMLDGKSAEIFEKESKKKFIEQPGQMQLLIVVDKLLTGFDAPSATYLYIDKNMQDHGLFQAICRVNRLDGEDKEYGYIVDYRDLFKKLEKAVGDYTAGALEGFEKEDVLGLLKDRLEEGKKDLDEALEIVRALCEPVTPPKDSASYIRYFCSDVENPYSLKENEVKRVKLYKSVSHLLRVYADLANDMTNAGFSKDQAQAIEREVKHFEQVRMEIKLASGDYIDLKKYEPAMRTLIDRYIAAEESEKLSAFDDMTLVDLIVKKGEDALGELPESIQQSQEAAAETVENNVRKLIIDKMPTNPKYYLRMSELLSELVKKRKQEDLEYKKYLALIIALSKKVKNPMEETVSSEIDTSAKRALYDNLGQDIEKAVVVHQTIIDSRQADWRGNHLKERAIKIGIKRTLPDISDEELKNLFEIVKNQNEY